MRDDLVRLASDFLGPDDHGVDPDQLARALDMALAEYSARRPHSHEEALVVSASGHVVTDISPYWLGPATTVTALIRGGIALTVRAVQANGIRTKELLSVGDNLQISFTGLHVVDEAGGTVPLLDQQPLACLTAAIVLDQLASRKTANRDSTISADALDSSTQSRDIASRARALRKRAEDLLTRSDSGYGGGSAVVNWSRPASDGRATIWGRR